MQQCQIIYINNILTLRVSEGANRITDGGNIPDIGISRFPVEQNAGINVSDWIDQKPITLGQANNCDAQ